MACELCGRSSCTRSFHSLEDQERFDARKEMSSDVDELRDIILGYKEEMADIRRETIEEGTKIMHSISTPDDKDVDSFIEKFSGEICREQAVVFMIQNATEMAFDAFAGDQS